MNITPQPEGLEQITSIVITTLKSLGKVLRTVSHLKPIQVAYQLKNRFSKPGTLKEYGLGFSQPTKLTYSELPEANEVLKIDGQRYQFSFLNLLKDFNREIDWNEDSYGKLWNYNLQYLDFLRQSNIPDQVKLDLLYQLYTGLEKGQVKLEPYTASLRIMNVIRFLSPLQTPDQKLQQWLQAEINYLSQNLEYHLLGNHLLENGFALLMGGHYYANKQWIEVATKLLKAELKEQIMEDGAHFELSPMYHQIILFRVLEAIDYLPKEDTMHPFLHGMASKMLTWLGTMTFRSGHIPHFNDSTDGIAFISAQLVKMASDLGLRSPAAGPLTKSGYRKLQSKKIELVADVHGISPSYQPGHAHADSLSFVMEIGGKPCVVDMGISTYQISSRRDYERSTRAHNTVTINDQDTAEVWSGFRVGRRPSVKLLKANDTAIQAQLSYSGFIHKRTFSLTDEVLSILDEVNGEGEAKARLYFHPSVMITAVSDDTVLLSNNLSIKLENSYSLKAFDYLYNQGYNLQTRSQYIEIGFTGQCRTKFILRD